MAEISDAIDSWLRDYVTDGVPASGINPPSKAEGRSIGAIIEAYVAGAVTEISGEGGATEIRCDVTANTGAVASGSAKYTFRLPHAMLVSDVRASLTAASSSGAVTVDINAGGVSILSTVLHVDEGDLTSVGSATPFVFATTDIADDTEITIDVDGAGASATGLKVTIIGVRTSFGDPTTPYFFGAGASAHANLITPEPALDVPFPAAILAGDIAILHVMQCYTGSDPSMAWLRPSGWTRIGTDGIQSSVSRTVSTALFWRRCDGTETVVSPTTNVAASLAYGRVAVFRGCVALGDPYIGLGQDNDVGLAMNGTPVVVTLNSCLVATFYGASAYSPSTPPDTGWTSLYLDTTTSGFLGQLLCASTHPAALAGTVAAETRTLSGDVSFGDTWATYALALIPGS